jgi:transposase
VIAAEGASAHLAHPLGVKAFEYRRVKNDVRDASDLADLLRMGRLPEAWIAPPATRELRELVRHRAKLVGLRSHCKAEIHAVLAKCGVQVLMTDLFAGRRHGPAGGAEPARPLRGADRLPAPGHRRPGLRDRCVHPPGQGPVGRRPPLHRGADHPRDGPTLGAVFLAEIGEVTRFARPEALTCWAGLTPKHRESDTHVRRGRITKQGSRLVRWAAVESVQILPKTTAVGQIRDQVGARRGRNIGVVAAARRQLEYVFYALRDLHVRALGTPPAAA